MNALGMSELYSDIFKESGARCSFNHICKKISTPLMFIAVSIIIVSSLGTSQAQEFGMSIVVTIQEGSDTIMLTGNTVVDGDVIIRMQEPNRGNFIKLVQITPDVEGNFTTEINIDEIVGLQDGLYTIVARQGNGMHEQSVKVGIMNGLFIKTNVSEPTFANTQFADIEPMREELGITLVAESPIDSDTIMVSGNTDKSHELITLKVTSPTGNVVSIEQVVPIQNGDYMANIMIVDNLWNEDGFYMIDVQQGENPNYSATVQVELTGRVKSDIPPTEPPSTSNTLTIMTEDNNISLTYSITEASLNNITVDDESSSMVISIDTNDDGMLNITLPREVIDAKMSGCKGADENFFVLVDGEEIEFEETKDNSNRTLEIMFTSSSSEIEIIGTCAISASGVPETSSIAVSTHKTSYVTGDTIFISGVVRDKISGTPVAVRVFAANGNLVAVVSLDVADNKTFRMELTAGGVLWSSSGEYSVQVQYGAATRSAETTFTFSATGQPPTPPVVVDPSTTDTFTLETEAGNFSLGYSINGGTLNNITVDDESSSMVISIDTNDDGMLNITLPREVIDAKMSGCKGADENFFVLVDGEEIEFEETKDNSNRTLEIMFTSSSSEIEIIGTCAISASDVTDTFPPLITLNGTDTIHISASDPHADDPNACAKQHNSWRICSYVEYGATATDNVDGDLTSDIIIDATGIDITTPGTYFVMYTVQDAAGNVSRVTRVVIVEDTLPPVIILNGDNPLIINIGDNFYDVDPGITATDNVDGDVSENAHVYLWGKPYPDLNTSRPGVYSVMYEVGDSSRQFASEYRTVVVVDSSVPDMTTPTLLLNGHHTQTITPRLGYVEQGAIAIDNIDGNITENIKITPESLDVSGPGTYQIKYSVQDTAGYETQTARTVNIVDEILVLNKPSNSVQGDVVIFNVGDKYRDYGVDVTELYQDIQIRHGSITTTPDNVDTSVPGIHTIVYELNDERYMDRISRTVVVVDRTSPDTNPPILVLEESNPYIMSVNDDYDDPGAIAIDGIDGDITDQIVVDESNLDVTVAGTYEVVYTVQDAAQNKSSIAREVIVKNVITDILPPLITLNGLDTVYISANDPYVNDPYACAKKHEYRGHICSYIEHGAIAIDNVDGDLTSSLTINASDIDTTTPGTYSVMYTVQDTAGNVAKSSRVVIVEDRTAPVITLNGDNPLIMNVGDSFYDVDPGVIAIDNVDGDITENVDLHLFGKPYPDLDTSSPGIYSIKYLVGDSVKHFTTEYRTVAVVDNSVPDTIPPILLLNGNHTQTTTTRLGYVEQGAIAIDNVDGNITESIKITPESLDGLGLGSYQIKYSVQDDVGHQTQTVRTVNMVDEILVLDKPYNSVYGDVVIFDVGDEYRDYGVDATELYQDSPIRYGSITTTPDGVDTSVPGIHTIVYELDDERYKDRISRTVIVVDRASPDTSPPILVLKESNPYIISVNDDYDDPGAIAIDGMDGDITDQIVVDESNLDVTTAGTYEVVYTVQDAAENKSSITRMVTVNSAITDTISPLITLNGQNIIYVSASDPNADDPNACVQSYSYRHFVCSYIEHGATAIDNVDGDITDSLMIDATEVDISTPGTYHVKYTVQDAAGNESKVIRTVIVADILGPIITFNGDDPLIINVGDVYSEVDPGAVAIDNVDGDVTDSILVSFNVSNSLPNLDTSIPGIYIVSYRANDSSEHYTYTRKTVIVVDRSIPDTIPPILTLNGHHTQTITTRLNYEEQGATALDNVDGDITGNIKITPESIDTSGQGSHQIKYSVQDAAGNISQDVRTINVVDEILVLRNPSNSDQTDVVKFDVGEEYRDYSVRIISPHKDHYISTSSVKTTPKVIDTSVVGIHTIVYELEDERYKDRVTRSVVVMDSTSPTMILNGGDNVILNLGDTYTDPGAVAIDKMGSILPAFALDPFDVLSDSASLTPGTYPIIYVIPSDDRDLARLGEIRSVTIQADTPTITPLGDNPISIAQGDRYTDYGARAIDTIGNPIPVSVDTSGVDTDVAGTYEVVYTVTDNGVEYTDTRTVHVYGVNINGPSLQFIQPGQPYEELGAISVKPDGTQVPSTPFDLTGFSGDELPLYPGTYPIIYYTPISDPDVRYNFLIGFRLVFVE